MTGIDGYKCRFDSYDLRKLSNIFILKKCLVSVLMSPMGHRTNDRYKSFTLQRIMSYINFFGMTGGCLQG